MAWLHTYTRRLFLASLAVLSVLFGKFAKGRESASALVCHGSVSYTHLDVYKRQIQDNFGRSLSLTYNAQWLLGEVTTPAGDKVGYTYDGNGNLTTVTTLDTHTRSYSYTSVTVDGHVEPALLTGLSDENAAPYAAWTYDASALAASSEHAGGVDRYAFTYQKDAAGKITGSSVRNPLKAVTQYTFQNLLGACLLYTSRCV